MCYPKRVAKQQAKKAWAKMTPTKDLVARITEALEWQKQLPDWKKDGGQYVPYPSTYLTQHRWEDEPPPELRPRDGVKGSTCPHTPGCRSTRQCIDLCLEQGRQERARKSA